MNAEEIVQAGIELADRQGLGQLSIRKLAAELGAGTMSAYRHIESREQLVQRMVDAALGAPPSVIGESGGWRERTTRWVEAIIARYVEHPWLTEAPVDPGFTTRNRAEWLESLLAALADCGLPLPQLLDAALLIDGYARAMATLARIMATASPPAAFPYDADGFPYLTQAFASGSLADGGALEADFGLQRILDGIEVHARTNRT